MRLPHPQTPFYHTPAELLDPPYPIQISQGLSALIKVNMELVGSLNFSRILSFYSASESTFAVLMQVKHAKKLLFLFTNKFTVDCVAVMCNCVWIFLIL